MSDKTELDDRVLEVVTEGLRAGPGTAAWEQAVREVSESSRGRRDGEGRGGGGASELAEMELLLGVRRRLELGRGWREVRAGDGFTQKLMSAIEAPPRGSAGMPLTYWVLGLALLGVVSVGVWGLVGLLESSGHAGPAGAASSTPGAKVPPGSPVVSYASPLLAWNFASAWPAQTAVFGELPTRADNNGWGPAVGVAGTPGSPAPGPAGVAAWLDIPLNDSTAIQTHRVAVEITLRLPPGVTDPRTLRRSQPMFVTQLFLTTAESLDTRLGTSPAGREWALQFDPDALRVATGTGEVVALSPGGGAPGAAVPTGTVVVLMELTTPAAGEPTHLALSVAGERIWTGVLPPRAESRRVGVRFLSRDGSPSAAEPPQAVMLRLFESR